MSELRDDMNAWRKHKQEQRERNRKTAEAELTLRKIPFAVHNAGAHLVVDGRIDYWPGTGLWIVRGGRRGRGLARLLREAGAPVDPRCV
jgi:hypothetical protein